MNLELPMTMILDCIFDPRNFQTEDVCNIQVHGDPLVELFLNIAWVQIIKEVRDLWRELRKYEDKLLGKLLDLLTVGMIGGEWCKATGSTGVDDQGNFARPYIHKDARFLGRHGASQLQYRAGSKLKEVPELKGMVGETERYFMQRLKAMEHNIKALCEDRGSPTMLDIEGLEDMKGLKAEE
ncbi:uncharacterized protein N0V89_000540 [Didymosphaeria variabile]|uniref:Uncharacterized protein n=1 Tax=Didymosphaeria variabile TaxID=1932322 RepID=A0A9W8XVI7_9PLEO|nr:uncharacterized protein N0V89_000540 [Didymosphaeria variabile]KAJ4359981.1 hypothetical protein N0V89_000540 [Didymosphaeria variabile]